MVALVEFGVAEPSSPPLLPGGYLVHTSYLPCLKYLGIENFTEAKCHSERSEESQSPVKV